MPPCYYIVRTYILEMLLAEHIVVFCRYSSRALVIPFKTPSIGPTEQTESDAFGNLTTAQQRASSAIGWAISLGKDYYNTGKDNVCSTMLPIVRDSLPGVDPRLCLGYACLLHFATKVCTLNVQQDAPIYFLYSWLRKPCQMCQRFGKRLKTLSKRYTPFWAQEEHHCQSHILLMSMVSLFKYSPRQLPGLRSWRGLEDYMRFVEV